MISPATIDEIKNKIDIVDVVGDFVDLKKSGSSYKALSPFTSEKTPSFYVVPSKGIFKDFSSGKGGDAITFVMEMDGLSYVEALKYLAKKYGIDIVEDDQTDENILAQNRRESLYIILNYASEFFSGLLWEHEEGRSIGLSYFKERGFSEDTIRAFDLGYTLSAWDHFLLQAEKGGYSRDLMEEAGLIIVKDEKVYDRFRNRVIFPIHNVTGKVVAFGARILSSDKKQPKYINSPETELYNKSKILYGIFQAKQPIRQEDNCFLVEGYTDVISMHQAGVRNVVASSGTSLTEEQVKLIRRYTTNVTILYDGDEAGIKASVRGIDLLLEGGLNVKALALPEGHDPDSYSRELGTSAFRHFLETQAQDIIRFKTRLFLKEAGNDPVKKAGLIKEIVRSITKIDDPVKRNVYLKDCGDLMGISEQVLIAEQNKILIEEHKKPRPQQEESVPELVDLVIPEEQELEGLDTRKVIELQEQESVRVLVNYGKHRIINHELKDEELINYVLAEIEEVNFINPVYREILQLFKGKLAEGEIIDGNYLISTGTEEIRKAVVGLMTSKYELSENWEKKFHIHVPSEEEMLRVVAYTNILRLKFRIVQHLIEEENVILRSLQDDKEIDDQLDKISELKKIEIDIAEVLGNVTPK